MPEIFKAKLAITPKPWARSRGTTHRVMPKAQREYYSALYMAMYDAGMEPVEAEAKLSLKVKFYRKDKRCPDLDNLIKAFLDAGQVSKWRGNNAGLAYVDDFWNDRQFAEIHAKRFDGAPNSGISVKISGAFC